MEDCKTAGPIREECKQKSCAKFVAKYNDCVSRIDAIKAKDAEGTCTPQYFDMWECVDKCVRSP
jgi:ubiquinol-cytochrome c reductase subunit 6